MENARLKTKEDAGKFFEGRREEKENARDPMDDVFSIEEVVKGVYGEKYHDQHEFDKTRRLLDELAGEGKIGIFRMSNVAGHQYLYGTPKAVERAEKYLSEKGGEVLEEIKKWPNATKGAFERMSDEQLKDSAIELHNSIYNRRCYGVHDLVKHEAILDELDRRGYEIEERSVLEFRKEKEDE
jgi:hypothetical protein